MTPMGRGLASSYFLNLVTAVTAVCLNAGCAKASSGEYTSVESTSAILQVTANELEIFDSRGNFVGSLDQDSLLTVRLNDAIAKHAGDDDSAPMALASILPQILENELIEGSLLHSVDSSEGVIASGTKIYFKGLDLDETPAVVIAGFSGDQEIAATLSSRLFVDSSLGEVGSLPTDEMDKLDSNKLRNVFAVGLNSGSAGAEHLETLMEAPLSLSFRGPTCSCKSGSCRISSPWGPRKSRNGSRGKPISSFHRGVDVSDYGKSGAPIVASEDGCVSKVLTNRKAGYGLTIFLHHNANLTTQYSHLQKFSITKGCVKKGALLGYMGSTGNVTGPHVHFAVLDRGTYEDPVGYVSSSEIISDSKNQCTSTKSVGSPISLD